MKRKERAGIGEELIKRRARRKSEKHQREEEL